MKSVDESSLQTYWVDEKNPEKGKGPTMRLIAIPSVTGEAIWSDTRGRTRLLCTNGKGEQYIRIVDREHLSSREAPTPSLPTTPAIEEFISTSDPSVSKWATAAIAAIFGTALWAIFYARSDDKPSAKTERPANVRSKDSRPPNPHRWVDILGNDTMPK